MFRGVPALDRTPVAAPALSAAGVLSLQAAARRDAAVELRYFGIVSSRSLRASTFAS